MSCAAEMQSEAGALSKCGRPRCPRSNAATINVECVSQIGFSGQIEDGSILSSLHAAEWAA